MNNVSFAGQLRDGGNIDLFNATGSEKTGQNGATGFLDLFRSQVFLDAQQDADSAKSQVFRSFSVSDSGFKPVNPWERPMIKEYRKIEKPESEGLEEKFETTAKLEKEQADKAPADKKAQASEVESSNPSEANESKAEVQKPKAELAPETAISDEMVEKIWNSISQTPELKELADNLSEEQKAELVTALMELPSEDLEIIAENPEILTAELLKVVEALPDSENKQQLLEMIDSDAFSALTEQLAEVVCAEKAGQQSLQDSEKVQTTSADNADEHANTTGKVKASKFAKATDAHKIESTSREESTEASELSEDSPESNSSATEKDADLDKAEKEYKLKDLHKKADLNDQRTDNSSEVEKNSQESLRSAFKKLNQNNSNQETPSASAINEQVSLKSESPSSESVFRIDQSVIAGKIATTDEVVRKIASTLMNQNSETGLKRAAFTYSPASINSQKGTTFHNNAGNGFSNGFSQSQSQSAQTVTRQVPNVNNSVFLSQLLEKAEMFKTSDGKKVLSLEMDPKELGKMEMELTSKDGAVTAKISAESELAKVRLEELAPQIKEHLNTQGINLTEITVDISSGHPDERNNQNLSERKNKSGRAEKVGLDNSEQIIRRNILPNLRKVALNIQSVDLTV